LNNTFENLSFLFDIFIYLLTQILIRKKRVNNGQKDGDDEIFTIAA